MSYTNGIVKGYSGQSASAYDKNSLLDKGDRERHKCILKDVLSFPGIRANSFMELGCGTGFFTEAIFEMFPGATGTLVDGSSDMLELAKTRLKGKAVNADFKVCLFQDIQIESMSCSPDIVFSSLAIHHLLDEDKWELFYKIYQCLQDSGCFILYDIFEHHNRKSQELLEYLACKDMQRRLLAELELDEGIDELHIDRIIRNDQRMRIAEGDQEAELELMIRQLEAAGFKDITIFLQEARFVGIICFKKTQI